MQSFSHLSLRQAGRAVEHSLTPMLDDLDAAAKRGRPIDVQDMLQRYHPLTYRAPSVALLS